MSQQQTKPLQGGTVKIATEIDPADLVFIRTSRMRVALLTSVLIGQARVSCKRTHKEQLMASVQEH